MDIHFSIFYPYYMSNSSIAKSLNRVYAVTEEVIMRLCDYYYRENIYKQKQRIAPQPMKVEQKYEKKISTCNDVLWLSVNHPLDKIVFLT